MAQTFFPITPVEVAVGSASAWTDVDVSAHIPSGSTGVILHVVNDHNDTDYSIGLRKNGSTDSIYSTMRFKSHYWAAIGVDANRIFEAYVGSMSAIDIYLVGYTKSGVTFFTNIYEKEPSSLSSWLDVDCSAEAPNAIGLIFQITGNPYGFTAFGLRKNGSTDNRLAVTIRHNTFGAIIGCDSSQICEAYREHGFQRFWLGGYITDGASFYTNGVDATPPNIPGWYDLTALPATANMGFVEINGIPVGANLFYGLRKNGSAEEITKVVYAHAWAFVECDSNHLIEGRITTTDITFFYTGYATAPPVPVVGIGAFYQQLSPLGINIYRAGRVRGG